MRRFAVLIVALVVVTSTAPSAWAQRGGRGGFGGPGPAGLGLLAQPSVESELKLSDEQKKQVGEHLEKQRSALGSLQGLERAERQTKLEENAKASEAAVASILNPEQAKRFKQIAWQQRGPRAYSDPEVATALGLSSEQKDKIKGIEDGMRSEMRTALGGGGGGDRQEARKKMEDLRKSTDEKLKAVLTAEQQSKWTSLTGEPFKGEIRRPQFRGNRPGANLRPNRRPNRTADRKV